MILSTGMQQNEMVCDGCSNIHLPFPVNWIIHIKYICIWPAEANKTIDLIEKISVHKIYFWFDAGQLFVLGM